jgi:hypothetical protein
MTINKIISIEDEIDATRIKLYELTKDMTDSEMESYFSDLVAPIYKKYGIKPISRAQQHQDKILPENSK